MSVESKIYMENSTSENDVELEEPIIFRTTTLDVSRSTVETGSLWLRSDRFYRALEDPVRNDSLEGVGVGTTLVPICIRAGGVNFVIQGSGSIGQSAAPHYLISLHGSNIANYQRLQFGGHTFGIRSLSRLSDDVFNEVSKQIKCSGYRVGPVSYQYAALKLKLFSDGDPIKIGGDPSLSLGVLNQDVLRKRPILPFIEQDEWRIAVFTHGYLKNDPNVPLKISVERTHFYPLNAIGKI